MWLKKLPNFLILLLAGLWSFHDLCANAQVEPRVVGGTTTTVARTPYLVNLRLYNIFICGGSLVTLTFVVTAAHCVKDYDASAYTVHGGSTYISQKRLMRNVEKIILPQAYNTPTYNMDVAVLKLASTMTRGTNIDTIALANQPPKVGDLMTLTGWGQTSESSSYSDQMRSVQLKIISKQQCQKGFQISLTNSMICATAPGKDKCKRDSGSPLVLNGKLYGIVSWGKGCARPNFPGVYTNIYFASTFINRAISDN